jgi:hypothetical protein
MTFSISFLFVCIGAILQGINAFSSLPQANHFVRSISQSKTVLNQSSQKNSDSGHGSSASRRNALQQMVSMSLLSLATTFVNAPVASAKEKEPLTVEQAKDAFEAVRYQLESPEGAVHDLESYVANSDFDAIFEFTKYYDLEFRKAKMVKARKYLTSKEDKERAVYLSNSVTFDLIGMNKGCRPGQRDMEQVRKYFGELKDDVSSFLELEKNIDYSVYVS